MSEGVIAVIEPKIPKKMAFPLSEFKNALDNSSFHYDELMGAYRIETPSVKAFERYKIIFIQTHYSPKEVESILKNIACVKTAEAMNAPYAICGATPPTPQQYQRDETLNQKYVNGNTKIGK